MDQRLPQHFDLNLKECFHLNNPDPHIAHRCGAWLACGYMCLWNTSDTQTETLNDLIARNSGNLWVNDPSCVSIYCDWSKLWSLRNVRLKKGRKEGGKGQIWIEMRRRENNSFTAFCTLPLTLIWDGDTQPTTYRKRSSKDEKTRPCDQRGDSGQEVVSSCWPPWQQHLIHSATTILSLTFDLQ